MNKVQTATLDGILWKIQEAKSEFFSVEFIKRTTGELRKMRCRRGVKKHLKGGTAAYDFAKKNVISVFDMDKMEYRVISVEGIQSLTIGGVKYMLENADVEQPHV